MCVRLSAPSSLLGTDPSAQIHQGAVSTLSNLHRNWMRLEEEKGTRAWSGFSEVTLWDKIESSDSRPASSALPVGYQGHNAAFYACLLSSVKLDDL